MSGRSLALMLVAVLALAACATAPKRAKAFDVAALRLDIVEAALDRAMIAADAAPGPVATVSNDDAGVSDAASSSNANDAQCGPIDPKALQAALRAASESITDAKAAVRTWSQGDDRQWKSAAPKLRQKLADLRDTMIALGLPVPPGLVEGMTAATPCCDGGAGGH